MNKEQGMMNEEIRENVQCSTLNSQGSGEREKAMWKCEAIINYSLLISYEAISKEQ
jgi:hypothetical protein